MTDGSAVDVRGPTNAREYSLTVLFVVTSIYYGGHFCG